MFKQSILESNLFQGNQTHSIKPGAAKTTEISFANTHQTSMEDPSSVAIQGSIGENFIDPAQQEERNSLNIVSKELDSFLAQRMGNKQDVESILQMSNFVGNRQPKPPGVEISQTKKSSSIRSPRVPQNYTSMMRNRKEQLSYDETQGSAQQVL
jgi:hypothetical protein